MRVELLTYRCALFGSRLCLWRVRARAHRLGRTSRCSRLQVLDGVPGSRSGVRYAYSKIHSYDCRQPERPHGHILKAVKSIRRCVQSSRGKKIKACEWMISVREEDASECPTKRVCRAAQGHGLYTRALFGHPPLLTVELCLVMRAEN